jgi:uncharacterized protein
LAGPVASAFTFPAKPAARVNDFAGVVDAASRLAIEEKLAAFEHASSNQLVVAVIPSLDGEAVEDVAVGVVESWGLGRKDRNNGVLLLIAMSERKARIEVGYGLEDRLTDALSRRILEERLFPEFRTGRYAAGILATCDGIIEATAGAYTGLPAKRKGTRLLPVVVPLIILAIFVLIGLRGGTGLTRGGRRRIYRTGPIWWGGGGFGGGGFGGGGFGGGGGGGLGGFSGGGGMSGGGGASGSW